MQRALGVANGMIGTASLPVNQAHLSSNCGSAVSAMFRLTLPRLEPVSQQKLLTVEKRLAAVELLAEVSDLVSESIFQLVCRLKVGESGTFDQGKASGGALAHPSILPHPRSLAKYCSAAVQAPSPGGCPG